MSQPSTPWTKAEADPFSPPPEQELYTQAQIEEAFAQHASEQPFLPSTYDDDLQANDFTNDSAYILKVDSSNTSNASTPLSGCSFGQQSPAYTLSGTSTPYPYPLEQQQQAYHVGQQYAGQDRPQPLRACTNSSFDHPAQPLRAPDRRRPLSHSDVYRIAATPSHPTFVRLQGFQLDDERRSARFLQHNRSRSHGPAVRGRPLQNAVPLPLIGTHIGTSLNGPKDKKANKSRKRAHKGKDDGERSPKFQDPLIYKMTDPAQLAQSRRIIEIGAMAVRNHSKLDPRLEDNDQLSPDERIMKKLEDVERYLQQDAAKNSEALRGCAMIREALKQGVKSIDGAVDVKEGDRAMGKDALEVPSKMMKGEDLDLGLFRGVLDDGDLMGMLMRENEQLEGGEEGL